MQFFWSTMLQTSAHSDLSMNGMLSHALGRNLMPHVVTLTYNVYSTL